MKTIFVIVDGLTDGLKMKTPLSEANLVYLLKIVKQSKFGLLKVITEEYPTSEKAFFKLLGYNYKKIKIRRGPLEALGINKYKKGSLMIRANFATVKNGLLKDRRAGRDDYLLNEIAEEVNKKLFSKYKALLFHTIGHRGVLIFYKKMSDKLISNDPNKVNVSIKKLKVKFKEKCKLCKESSKVINSYLKEAYEIMENSKYNELREKKGKLRANYLLLRQFGKSLPKVKKLTEKYNLKFACICGNPLEIGISKLLGMKVYKANEGNSVKIIKERVNLLKRALKESNFVIVHIKGPDEFGHDGDFEGKRKMIELIDKVFFKEISKFIGKYKIVITNDHSTPWYLKKHSKDECIYVYHNPKEKIINNLSKISEVNFYKYGKELDAITLFNKVVKS